VLLSTWRGRAEEERFGTKGELHCWFDVMQLHNDLQLIFFCVDTVKNRETCIKLEVFTLQL
jgi:hypothetical protein